MTAILRSARRAALRVVGDVHRAGHGLVADAGLYASGALFAGVTAVLSTLPAHRAWGRVAVIGYVFAVFLTAAQALAGGRWRGPGPRAAVLLAAWGASTLLPLVMLAAARARGTSGRAQEEVVVVERGAERLLETGTPYLGSEAIERLTQPVLGYLPYQPGMTVFGLPRAVHGDALWTDARVWFALTTAAVLLAALRQLRSGRTADGVLLRPGRAADADTVPLRSGPTSDAVLLRAAQAVTVLPICALTLATGGDDLPVLALCLLALAFAARGRSTAAGLAVGAAAALKLFAWPVVVVLLFHSVTVGRRAAVRLAVPAVALPLVVLAPVTLMAPRAAWENLVEFPLGRGVVASPAASPLPGHLLAIAVPHGGLLATALLLGAAGAIGAWLLRRPPRTAADCAVVCAIGLLTAILLMPATRFGYLLYPIGYTVWFVALQGRALAERPGVPSGAP